MSFNTSMESAAAAALLQQVRELDPRDQACFIAQTLASYFDNDGLGTLMDTIGRFAQIKPDGPTLWSILLLQQEADNQGVKGWWGDSVWKHLSENESITPEIVDLLADRKPSALIPTSSGNQVKAPVTGEQLLRVIQKVSADGDAARALLNRYQTIATPEHTWAFARNWVAEERQKQKKGNHNSHHNQTYGHPAEAIAKIIKRAVDNPATPADIVQGIYDVSEFRRPALALHPNLPQESFDTIVQVLVESPWGFWPKDWMEIAPQLVRSPRLPESVMMYLLDEKLSWRYLASNPALPAPVRQLIIDQGDGPAYLGLVECPTVASEEFDGWFRKATTETNITAFQGNWLPNHPLTRAKHLVVLADLVRSWNKQKLMELLRAPAADDASIAHAIRCAAVAELGDLAGIVKDFLKTKRGQARVGAQALEAAIASAKKASWQCNTLRESVAQHPAVTMQLLDRLSKYKGKDVASAVRAAKERLRAKKEINHEPAEAASA